MLTKTPKNVVVEAGMNVTLECASSDSASSNSWLYDASLVATSPCRSTDSRFVATSVANGCFLTALGNNSIQGPYGCRDGVVAQAVVIVIGKILKQQPVECCLCSSICHTVSDIVS